MLLFSLSGSCMLLISFLDLFLFLSLSLPPSRSLPLSLALFIPVLPSALFLPVLPSPEVSPLKAEIGEGPFYEPETNHLLWAEITGHSLDLEKKENR